jgi:hypothetical protein
MGDRRYQEHVSLVSVTFRVLQPSPFQKLGICLATCYTIIKLEFLVAWVQDDSAKIITSTIKV